MLKQNVYILNFNELYQIFNEVQNILNFDVFKIDDSDLQKIYKTNNLKDSILITNSKTNFKISTMDKKDFLILESLPIFLPNLIEKINIFFLKIKFNFQNKIHVKNYNINLNNRTIYKGNVDISLTEKEIQIILFLLNKKTPQKTLKLQNKIWNYNSNLETHTVETHIYRLRKKIKNIFRDDKFILSDENGYYL